MTDSSGKIDDMDTSVKGDAEPNDTVVAGSPADRNSISVGHAAIAGVLGAAISLALGELFDRLSGSLSSLVIGMFDLLVDITPGGIVAWSINTLGTLQKPFLVTGIVVGSLAIGALLGVAARKNPTILAGGFLLFGVIGGFATSRSDLTSAPGSWIVALLAAVVGAATALGLIMAARGTASDASSDTYPLSAQPGTVDRRTLLYGGAAAAAVAVTAAARVGRTSAAEIARDEIVASAGNVTAVNVSAVSGGFDDVDGITSFVTPISPSDEFYLIDTAFRKPEVNPDTWSLTINGLYADTPMTYTYDDLLNRDDLFTSTVTLSCVSNPVGGDLVGNAVWTGVPLSALLDEAGIQDPEEWEHQIFSRSVDGFTCGFQVPIAYDGRTAMVALMMNGEPLPIAHGFPARLVIAGLYGYVSATKWLEQIEITDWDGVDGFWQPRGWAKYGPVKTQSRIDTPTQGGQQPAGAMTIAGVAWNPGFGIEQVEVGFTNAETQDSTQWFVAELAEVETDETWVQWRFDWDGPAGDWFIQSRATDKSGFTQSPIPVAPAPNGAEGYHTIAIRTA